MCSDTQIVAIFVVYKNMYNNSIDYIVGSCLKHGSHTLFDKWLARHRCECDSRTQDGQKYASSTRGITNETKMPFAGRIITLTST